MNEQIALKGRYYDYPILLMRRLRVKSPTQDLPTCWVLMAGQPWTCRLLKEVRIVSPTWQVRGPRIRDVKSLSWSRTARKFRDWRRSVCSQGYPLAFTGWRVSVPKPSSKDWASSCHVLSFWVFLFVCLFFVINSLAHPGPSLPHPVPTPAFIFEANPRSHIIHVHIPWCPGSLRSADSSNTRIMKWQIGQPPEVMPWTPRCWLTLWNWLELWPTVKSPKPDGLGSKPASPLTGWLHSLGSEPQFSHLSNGGNNSSPYYTGLLRGVKWTNMHQAFRTEPALSESKYLSLRFQILELYNSQQSSKTNTRAQFPVARSVKMTKPVFWYIFWKMPKCY